MNKNILVIIDDNNEPMVIEFYYANSDKYILLNKKLRDKRTKAVYKGLEYEVVFLHNEGSEYIYEIRRV